MELKYRPAAIKDMKDACDYIQVHLKNPTAAKSLKIKLLRGASLLGENPFIGVSLDSRYDGFHTDLRFLVISKHMIFYRVHEDLVEIVRILDGRTDYLSHLLDE